MSVREATQVAVEKVHHAAHEWTCSGEHLGGEGERSDERLEGGELDGGLRSAWLRGVWSSLRRSGVHDRVCSTESSIIPRKAMCCAGSSVLSGLTTRP